MTAVVQAIEREYQHRQAAGNEDTIAMIARGQASEAIETLLFFTPPRTFPARLDRILFEIEARFKRLDEDLETTVLDFLVELTLGLNSFLPRWNLQHTERHGTFAMTEADVAQAAKKSGDLAVALGTQSPIAASRLLSTLQAETAARFRAEKAQDPEAEAQAIAGGSLKTYLTRTKADIAHSHLRRIAEMRDAGLTPTELGNDYAQFLKYAMLLGISFVTTNPVLIDIAWQNERARWNEALDAIVAEHPSANADERVRLLTVEIVLDSMRRLRPLFLLTRGQTGYVCLQVNPREHDDAGAMIAYASSTYETMRHRLDGGVPNVVFKLPATKAGLEACAALVQHGIGVTITVCFGLFQHLPFARVIASAIGEGRALVSYLVEMNGRLAYPVRDELLAKADVLAELDIDEAQIREAAAWAGVAVLKKLHRLLGKQEVDLTRIRPLVASLRIYQGQAYRTLPGAFPDITETLGTGTISVFPDVRNAFDGEPECELQPRQVEQSVPEKVLAVLAHSELFRQAYYVADRYWVSDEDARFCPAHALTLQDEARVLAWAPVRHTLGQFIESYDALIECVQERM
ncbi:MAG: hypothetical protein JXA89_23935 [Anaerolineae bacterium]|nr:hypothetical protein [Anaerolineae bacterium]